MTLDRVAAVVRADFLIRFRRLSTLVLFLLICFIAYLWIPDPSTGRALLQINGQRALYNSAAIGMATALVGTIFVGLIGFYIISNAIGRDITTRCGSIIAATSVRTTGYLVGKFIGNIVFLTVFLSGFMVSSMVMLLIRAEAPLDIGKFTGQYLILAPPTIVLVSAMAVLFESIPALAGRGGDVLYFFVWMASMGSVAVATALGGGKAAWPRYFDHSGFFMVITQVQEKTQNASISIGSSPFDPARPPIVFEGLQFTRDWLMPRIVSLLWPLALLVPARLAFHRFDPARTRAGSARRGASLVARLGAIVRPFSRLVAALPGRLGAGSVAAQAGVDALETLALSPLAVAASIGLVVVAFTPAKVFAAALPFCLAPLGILLADVPCRDARRGTLPMIYAAPRLRENFVPWKALSMGLTSLIWFLPVILRTALTRPAGAAQLAVGVFFIVAAATFLGIVSRNPKTLIVLFLSFWYLMVNSGGKMPGLDFAGIYGSATAPVTAAYAAVGAGALLAAHLAHRRRLARG